MSVRAGIFIYSARAPSNSVQMTFTKPAVGKATLQGPDALAAEAR